MPRFRDDLDRIAAYKPGTPIEEAARQLGMDDIVKLASNECPLPPFPEVQQAIAKAAATAHRYPDNDASELRAEVAKFLSVPQDSIVFGTGSASLMMISALALGGPGRSIAYGWPSFGLYRIAARTSFSTEIEVQLTGDHRYDLKALAAAIRPDTSLVYLCNPNNPTGTYVPLAAVADFISALQTSGWFPVVELVSSKEANSLVTFNLRGNFTDPEVAAKKKAAAEAAAAAGVAPAQGGR